MSLREKIDNLIIEADKEIQAKNFPSGLQKLEIAKQMATEIGWDERIGMIASLIEDANKKIKIQEEHDKKLKEIERKKLEDEEKEKQLEIASQRLKDKKKEEQLQKIDEMRKKKEFEDRLSSEAYDLLETGSKALQKDDYHLGKESFAQALEKFKTIKWSAEITRTQELLNDAEGKYKKYQQKLKDDEIKAEKVWEAQKNTREQIELSKKLQEQKLKEQESIDMEAKKEELLKKEKSDKALSLLDDAIQFRNLNKFSSAINAYKEALEIFKEIGWQKEAIEVEEEINLTFKQKEKLELEKKKLEENLIKKRLDEEEIEKRASESHRLKESKEEEERNKRQKELEALSQKEAILTEILGKISSIEEEVNLYEDQVHLGKIISLECPYPKAITVYGDGSQKLREIGFYEQADRLAEGERTYKQRIFEDEKLRVNEKKRLEKIKQEEEEIEKKTQEAQKLRDEKLRIQKEKRQQELEKLSKKDSALEIVLNNISIIEEVISGYESRVGLGKILSLESPYPKAIELYYIGTNKLREIGLIEQADRLEEGANTYKQKIVEDDRLRELEKKRLEKVRLENEEIEEKARESKRLREEKLLLEKEKRQNELEKHSLKESQLKEVLSKISEIEDKIYIFENQSELAGKISPYPEAIELYSISSKKLSEFGFHEQAKLLKDGEISYKQKLVNFNKTQEDKKKYLEKLQKDKEEIEKKAEEARKIKDQKEKKLREKRQKELEKIAKKESKLKDVLGDISKIEDVVNEYAREVGLGKILSLECPYPKAVELYNIGMQKLREAGLIEQADRLDEGRKTYERKINEDEKLREREKQRIEKARLDEEEIEKKAEDAQKIVELKEKELREKRQQELEALSRKESKLKTVLNDISKIEDVVNEYAREVGLGKILSLECPYPKAVELYNIGMQKLREAGLIEQADRLDEGRKTYERKINEDEKLRQREEQRIEKARLDEEEIEKKAAESQRIKEEKETVLREKRQQELEALSKKESKLKTVLDDISKIEDTVSEYAKEVGLGKILSLECPYPKAVELYNIGMQKLREAGLIEQADRLDEGRKTYERKIIEDEKHRSREKQRIEKARLDEEEIEKKAEDAQKIVELKEKELREKRQQELEALSKKEAKLKNVLNDISKIEDVVSEYTREVGLGKILSLECPYPKAVELYNIGTNKLREAGLIEQADRLDEGRKTYEHKIIEDEKHRSREKQRIEKARLDEEEIEKQAIEARRIKELKDKEQREKRQKDLEALSKKESKLKNVLNDISKIEDVVNEYAREVGLGKILSLECPYPKAVELYNIGTNKLREAGLIEQADRLDEGRKTYERKIIEDEKHRSREKKRIEKARLDEEEIEKKAEEARKIIEIKEKELREKRQQELEALSKKETKLRNVLDDISKIEDVVNEYAREVGLGRILSLECPYPKAVELYNIGMQKLRESGLIEQADRLDEGRKTYERKILEDEKLREREKQRIEKARLDEEEIERKAEEAQQIKEQKETVLREKRQKELEVISKKESKLKTVLDDISKIEDVVSEYAREVGLGRILSLECPYPKAVELYNIGMQKLRETGLTEQADRLDEGRKTYERKILEDEKLREREKQRIEKNRLEKEEFERKASESQRKKEEKELQLREKRQKELETISQKESKLKNVLGDISKIEDVVNEYAKGVGLGKILSLECPYPKAVELYNIGTKKLREIGLIEQADTLEEGTKTYERKIIEDKRLRDLEKQRLVKIEVDKEKIELQAQVEAKLKEIKQKEKGEKKKKEQDKLSNQREILTEALSAIDKIERKVKKYEDQVGLGKILTSKCPYSDAIEVYKTGSEKLKHIGLLEQSIRLNEGYVLYKDKLIFDEKNREFEEESIRKDQESKLEIEQQILESQKKKEAQLMQKEEEKAVIQKKSQSDQNKASKAFNLMDEGNDLAVLFKFDDAIEKFQEAMDIFDEIKWLAELDKVLLQISIFRKQKDQKELEKIEEEELKIKKLKEMEEIDQKAKLSWEKKLEEERKKSEIKQSETEEKRKQWELEFQGKVEEDKKKREIEDQQRLEQLKREQEIGLKHQNVYNECLNLLDQAKTLVTEQQFESAISIYKNVTEKYKDIKYSEGIRLTNESILKVQKLWDDHRFDIEIAQKSMKEREEEEKRLERLIKESKQKDERKKLIAEQKKLKIQLEKEKEAHTQNEIVSLLEIAGDLTKENQFDKALEYYDKSLELFKKINWDLKYKQVLSIIQDVKAKKKHFIKLEKQFEEKQKKDQKAQKAFKDFLIKQEAERKSKGEKIKKLTEQQQIEQNRRVTLEDAAYEYIDQAESCVKGRTYYLSLYYFHYALNNFIDIEWDREAKALKKRFLQVYNLIRSPLMDINEILTNPKLDLEYHFANSLSLILMAKKRKDFLVAQTELNTVCEMAKNLKWPKSLKLLEDFKEILEKEKEDYKREIEMKKYAPTEGKALQLMKEASGNIKNNEFEEGLALANKAKEIYIQMGIEREARKVEQELLRWKLKYTRYQLNQQREKSKTKGPEKKTFLSENERKNLIIEERKRRRREARKKLLGD